MSSTDDKFLVVGLGNPGQRYEKTRHNYGFMVVEAFARKQGWLLKSPWKLRGKVASGIVKGRKVYVLMPLTYMNLSGGAVVKMMHMHKIALQNVMVVVDDVALPFGTMRLRAKGSTGGHNGLASLEQSLQTQAYARMRMGVGNQLLTHQPLEEFVLGRFQAGEEAQLSTLIDRGVEMLEHWLEYGIESAMQQVGS
ncbi:MAG: aminoacyl-tRNA hydrolase [Verrucomicrobia bacterium]|nr:aminoacyl-tRNA hydrolase [Verrucomicrobiota bacterium]MBS0646618.1 aminoacyl-tRNA hydrolase [Verrucomicrobiota bacterium]